MDVQGCHDATFSDNTHKRGGPTSPLSPSGAFCLIKSVLICCRRHILPSRSLGSRWSMTSMRKPSQRSPGMYIVGTRMANPPLQLRQAHDDEVLSIIT